MTLFAQVASCAADVAAAPGRSAKRDRIAALLAVLTPEEIPAVVGFLTGGLRQGRIGVGWASVREVGGGGAVEPTLTVADVDGAASVLADTTGAGSQAARAGLLAEVFGRATPLEADFLVRLIGGELHIGALEGIVTDAVISASGLDADSVRRAVMLSGDLGAAAGAALAGGAEALAAIGLELLRPVQPMLASTAASVAEAVQSLGEVSVEWKLDGARIQAHRDHDRVAVFTRNGNDVTARLPEVVEVIRSMPCRTVVLDGEVLGFIGPEASPQAFQDTMSRFGRDDGSSHPTRLVPHFFDILHLDGDDVMHVPLAERRRMLGPVVGSHLIPGVVTSSVPEAEAVLTEALARGHEGVMVKGADSAYEAGRRGKSWRKVKPVHTFDLVVLAVEWGHGRRTGLLSNLHLGARDGDRFVMVGKTFKGLTDELLAWQTARFTELAERTTRGTVWVRPEQVVEIAIDGVQASTRYPGGVALRFARVRSYRHDKPATEADTLASLQAMLPSRRSMP